MRTIADPRDAVLLGNHTYSKESGYVKAEPASAEYPAARHKLDKDGKTLTRIVNNKAEDEAAEKVGFVDAHPLELAERATRPQPPARPVQASQPVK